MGRRPVCVLCLLLILFLCIGRWMGMPLTGGVPIPAELKEEIGDAYISAVGEVERCADTKNSQSVYLKDVSIIYESNKISIGNVRVFLKKREELPAGSLVLVSGILEEVGAPRNPGEFDSRQYYACSHVYYFLKKAVIEKKSAGYSGYRQFLLDAQEKFGRAIDKGAKDAAPVFRAIVLGDKSDLETETKMRYQMAGIIHILAISGLHISILGAGLYEFLKKIGFGIWGAGMLSLFLILHYGMMTGGSVSAMRAVTMFLLSVGAKMAGRIYDLMTALSLSAIILLLESPAYLYNPGFLLSFGAVLGVGAVLPVFLKLFEIKGKILKSLMGSVCVQLTTLPVMLWFYGEISVIGIFLNLLVLPTVGIVLVSGVMTALAGSFFPFLASCFSFPGRLVLWGYDKLCSLGCSLPFCTWTPGQPEVWQAGIYWVFLFSAAAAAGWVMKKKENQKMLPWIKGVFVLSFCAALFLISRRKQEYLEITCLDVGQGDAIAAEFPTGEVFLTDGGSSNKKNIGQYQLLPFLKNKGISYIDGIFISHTDEDHISGVREILEYRNQGLISLKIGNLILPGITEKPKAWMELKNLAEKAGIQVHTANKGDRFRVGEGELLVLSPEEGASGEDINEDAVVFLLSYRNFRGLFTGDIGEETEKKLLPILSDVDFLKVGHHGSGYSSGASFLGKIRPKISVISCSASNTYGHPSPEAVKRLENVNSKVEYTMKSGAVTVVTDGGKVGIVK